MDIQASAGSLATQAADAVMVSAFEGAPLAGAAAALDSALNGALSDLLTDGDFSGKPEQVAVLYPRGVIPARRVILVGLGKAAAFTADAARRGVAAALLKARELKVKHAASALFGEGLALDAAAQVVAEGALLAAYHFRGQKSGDETPNLPTRLDLIVAEGEQNAVSEGIRAGIAISAGVRLARDLVNQPPNVCNPAYLANAAAEMAQATGLKCQVLGKAQMEALKMGALLGVAQGSVNEPRFIILEHNGDRTDLPTLVLVGKGVTFDTGGYDIKTFEGMSTMKGDMAGGAAVIGALGAVAGLNLPLRVIGLIPTADNMISGAAYRPSDILTASNGVTIEIISTDAEGRLLLADALVYAQRYQPAAVVDIATLTGSCVTALGEGVAAGVFSTDDRLRDRLVAAGTSAAERVWPLPLYPDYDRKINSLVADIKNSGGSYSGVGTSAAFLKRFVANLAWAHIDMAGMTFNLPETPYAPAGASGFGVRLLTAFVRGWV
jgi:leucyl aminopeptidase